MYKLSKFVELFYWQTSGGIMPSYLIPVVAVAVVLIGVVVGAFTIMAVKAKRARVDLWARGAYSLWTGGEDCASWAQDRAQSSLENWYGASSSNKFWNVIQGLRQGQTTHVAWDRVRALDLLRIGLAATYIDEDQARRESIAIAQELQQRYRSWDELAIGFEQGMQAWQHSRNVTDPNETGRVQRNLPTLRGQIWPKIPFQTEMILDDND